ncbi:MAG: ParA family protein [Mixta calida]|uniref:ParA family protein n=1 Tax=Erwiniaceae TaxID=1903409 RepID=UPI0028A6A48C|nr:ParA family protein [Pantoea sp.]MDU3074782.1 ParA family protein [Mixta calida]
MTLSAASSGKLIVVCSQKGGIVKSQSTKEVAFDLRKMGFSVLEIDLDWTTGLTERTFPDELPLAIEREPLSHAFTPGEANAYQLFFPDTTITPIILPDGRHFIGATSELNEINYRNSDCMFDFRDRINELKTRYDFILADSAPSYSNVMIASHMSADYLIIPTLLEKQSRNAVGKQLTYMQKIKKNYNPALKFLGVYITQATVTNYNKPLKEGYLGQVETHNLLMLIEILESKGYSEEFILACISYMPSAAKEAIELGLTFHEYDPKCRPAVQYAEMTRKIVQLTGAQ